MSEHDLHIRRADAGDVGSLASLMGELGYPLSEADMANRMDYVAASPEDEIFVAEVAGEVVGMIGLRVSECIDRVGRYGEITALCVSSNHRRQGVATGLIRHIENVLTGLGVAACHVCAGMHREHEGHKFYQRMGFEPTGVRFIKSLRPDA